MTRIVSFWLLVAIIVAVALVFYRVMSGFLLPLFLAALLVVIFKPVHNWILARVRRPIPAAVLSTVLVVLVVFVPTVWSLTMAATEAISAARQFDANRVTRQIQRLRVALDLDVPVVEDTLDLEPVFDELARANEKPDVDTPPIDAELVDPAMGDTPDPRVALLDTVQRRVLEIGQQLPNIDPASNRTSVREATARLSGMREAVERAQQAVAGGNWAAYKESLADARRELLRLRSLLPGGAVRVWVRDLANPSPEQLKQWTERVANDVREMLVPAANATVGFAAKLIFGTIIMIVSVFFFFADGPRMTDAVIRLIPLDVRHQTELLGEFGNISRAVVMATIVSAFVQSAFAGLGFYFANVESVALLMLLTFVFAMIPFVGALAVWAPVCVWVAFVEGRTGTAILLALYCAVVVSQSDNVVKPLILKGKSNIHPLLALLSILGGVQALGPVGILVGPMVVVFLQTLLKILHREMSSLERPAGELASAVFKGRAKK